MSARWYRYPTGTSHAFREGEGKSVCDRALKRKRRGSPLPLPPPSQAACRFCATRLGLDPENPVPPSREVREQEVRAYLKKFGDWAKQQYPRTASSPGAMHHLRDPIDAFLDAGRRMVEEGGGFEPVMAAAREVARAYQEAKARYEEGRRPGRTRRNRSLRFLKSNWKEQ